MRKLFNPLLWAFAFVCLVSINTAAADNVLIIDAGYSTVTANVQGRLEAAGHTVTVTTDTSQVPTATGSFQQVWDLRYMNALTSTEVSAYSQFITAGGFAYFTTENPGCCMSRNNSIAALVTSLGGGSTQIGPGWAANIVSNVNTTYMTTGLTVNFAAIAAIVNSQGIPLISDANGNVAAMSWIGRAGALGSGVTGTIITVADINWLDSTRFDTGGTSAQQQNVTALDDIIRGVVAGTVAGTISASGNGAGATNGNNGTPPPPPAPSTFDHADANENVSTDTMTAGNFTGNGGTLTANSNALSVTNPITLTSNGLTYDANGLNSTLSGVISGVGGMTFTGGGTTTLTGTNTYTGPTLINSGASLVNNGSITSSSITNNGTFVNNGLISNIVNYGLFTNAGTTGDWVNGGLNQVNTSVINNSGTMGNGINYGLTFNNAVGATVGNVTNFGVFNNNGTMGAVQNAGMLVNTGTIASINNAGVFVANRTNTTLSSYTQTGSGSTVLAGNQTLTVTGAAQLGGNLTILNSPSALGKYVFITGDTITGQYDSLISDFGVLRYIGGNVELWVMPSNGSVQGRLDSYASDLDSMNAVASNALTGSLGSDCSTFGALGGCVVINYAYGTSSPELNTGGVTIIQRLNDTWRLGVFTSKMFNNPAVGNMIMESDSPSFGAMIGWNENRDGLGWGASFSGVMGSGRYIIGSADRANINARAYQARVTYSYPLTADAVLTPYVGLRYTNLEVGGYTERSGIFPLSFNSVGQTSVDLFAGTSISYRIATGLTGSLNLGVVQNLRNSSNDVVVNSDMGAFRSPLSSSNYTAATLGGGLSYEFIENHRVGLNLGWQQRGITDANITSVGVSYTFSY